MAPAGAAAVSIATGQTGPVTANPANTPQRNANGSVEQVRQLVQCGSTMYAVGTFTSIKHNSTVYTREQRLQLQRDRPVHVTSWAPNVNGIVNSIAFNGTNCADAYIGGKFTAVNGTTVKNIAEVSTSGTGAVVTTFGHSANGQVETLLGVEGPHPGGRLLHLDQRQHRRPVHDQPEPDHRQGRRVHAPEHLRQLPVPRRLQQRAPGSTTSRSATAARWTW